MKQTRYSLLSLVVAAMFTTALAPATAQAECGDYLMVAGQHDAAKAATAEQPAGIVKSELPAVPSPCHGPNCSQRRQAPVLPPAPAPTIAPGEWACVFATLIDLPPVHHARTIDGASDCPVERADPIFHPPRITF